MVNTSYLNKLKNQPYDLQFNGDDKDSDYMESVGHYGTLFECVADYVRKYQ